MSLRTNIRNSPADPSTDPVGTCDEQSFPLFRTATLDTLEWGRKRHHIPLMLEVDATVARDGARATTLPMPYIIRKANEKSMLPKFARDLLVWRRLQGDPFFMKRMMGTVSVTSIGMAGHGGIGWGIPLGIHPLILAVGGISPRPLLVEDRLHTREHLGLTVLFDHDVTDDVTDGAPVARFVGRLRELMECAYVVAG